ncbi:dienelactone hydrolase family protein [Streptomyces lavendulocolor]|uniref:dienelactone hydrolase family protein n=1 Tax=Streptomyces lavendulocolor TaxID=67316 RepID=UPI0033C360A8
MTKAQAVSTGVVAAVLPLLLVGTSGCAADGTARTSATPAAAPASSATAHRAKALPVTPQSSPVKSQPSPPAPAKPAQEQPQLVRYQLPPGVIHNQFVASGVGPSQAHGVLGIPRGKGPRPVVVVLHGSHPTCVEPGAREDGVVARPVRTTWPLVCADPKAKKKVPGVGPDYLRNNAGLSYIVQGLARKGFVAVAIDVTGAEAWWGGEPSPDKGYAQLIDAHLKLLSDLNRGNDRGLALDGVKGRIDTARIGLVGHSRGGGYVLEHAAKRPGLFAAVSIEPASDFAGRHTVPVLNIRGACDEDTGPDAGLAGMKALAKSRTTSVAADVLLAGTGHAMLNTNLDPAERDGSVGSCAASKAAGPGAARDQVAQLTAAFMDQALRRTTAYRLPSLKATAPTGRNLGHTSGPRVTFSPTTPHAYTDPLTIREVTSRQRLLPPIPKNIRITKGEDY